MSNEWHRLMDGRVKPGHDKLKMTHRCISNSSSLCSSLLSLFTRVFDALWRCTADPGRYR